MIIFCLKLTIYPSPLLFASVSSISRRGSTIRLALIISLLLRLTIPLLLRLVVSLLLRLIRGLRPPVDFSGHAPPSRSEQAADSCPPPGIVVIGGGPYTGPQGRTQTRTG